MAVHGPKLRGGVITIEILQLVDQLEDLLNQSWRIPGTSTLLVNETECLRIIDQLRAWLPEDMKEGWRAKAGQERVIDQPGTELVPKVGYAQGAYRLSGDRVGTPIAPTSVEERGRTMLVEAEREAQALREGAAQYARESMDGLQRELEALLDQVRRGIAYLDAKPDDRLFGGR